MMRCLKNTAGVDDLLAAYNVLVNLHLVYALPVWKWGLKTGNTMSVQASDVGYEGSFLSSQT